MKTTTTPVKQAKYEVDIDKIAPKLDKNVRDAYKTLGFKIVVDSDSIGKSNIVRPVIEHTPEGLFDIRTEPVFIECLVN